MTIKNDPELSYIQNVVIFICDIAINGNMTMKTDKNLLKVTKMMSNLPFV